jgi:hypothetical protein
VNEFDKGEWMMDQLSNLPRPLLVEMLQAARCDFEGLQVELEFCETSRRRKEGLIQKREAENKVLREQNFDMNKTIAKLREAIEEWRVERQLSGHHELTPAEEGLVKALAAQEKG